MTRHHTKSIIEMRPMLGISVFVLLVLATIFFATQRRPLDNSAMTETIIASPAPSMLPSDNSSATPSTDTKIPTETSSIILAGKSSMLLDFKKNDYDAALKTDKVIVLYFCTKMDPECTKESKDALYPAFNELLGDAVIGFRMNYSDREADNDEIELARQFSVTNQLTKVFVKKGKMIFKATENWNKQQYLAEINRALDK